jgi:hypothetical protein
MNPLKQLAKVSIRAKLIALFLVVGLVPVAVVAKASLSTA